MRRFGYWLRHHPWVGTAFSAGALLGVLICLPLVPYSLPSSTATIIGAALGAFLAVWGAAWIADGRVSRERAIAANAISNCVAPLADLLPSFIESFEVWIDARGVRHYRAIGDGKLLHATLDGFKKRLAALEPLFSALGANGVIVYADLAASINSVNATVSSMAGSELDGPIAASWNRSEESSIEARFRLQNLLGLLSECR